MPSRKESARANSAERAGRMRAERPSPGASRGEGGSAPRVSEHEHGEAPPVSQGEGGQTPRASDGPDRLSPRRRVRHIPAAVKREVFLRDAGRCGYVDEQGCRCDETRYLELHHLRPFAWGGEHAAANLGLRCAAHNALAAENDFGRGAIEQKRRSARHDSLAAQKRGRRKLGQDG